MTKILVAITFLALVFISVFAWLARYELATPSTDEAFLLVRLDRWTGKVQISGGSGGGVEWVTINEETDINDSAPAPAPAPDSGR